MSEDHNTAVSSANRVELGGYAGIPRQRSRHSGTSNAITIRFGKKTARMAKMPQSTPKKKATAKKTSTKAVARKKAFNLPVILIKRPPATVFAASHKSPERA